ncbi:MAG: metallophosphoesterase, partial [Victivallales bacterium]|nr:metallophosphoesterase [Victivallales bacterium]
MSRIGVLCLLVIGGMAMAAPTVAPLKFASDGTFKIVQFTDTHLEEIDQQKGQDNSPAAMKARAEQKCAAIIAGITRIVEKEKPDLVVFTGDNVFAKGSDTAVYWR